MSQPDELRRLAEAATPGPWEPYFTVHGDPYVTTGQGMFGAVAEICTAPDDYGRADAEFIAAVDPPTVLALLDRIERLEAQQAAALEAEWERIATWLEAAEEAHYGLYPDAEITWGDAAEHVRDGCSTDPLDPDARAPRRALTKDTP